MKPLFCTVPTLAALLCLSACETGRRQTGGAADPVKARDVRALVAKHESKAAKYRVFVQLVQRGRGAKEYPAAQLDLRPGQKGTVGQLSDFPWPAAYDYPKILPAKPGTDDMLVSPMTPSAFEVTKTGWSCDVTALPKGGLIEIKGTFTETTCEGFVRCPGEVSVPILSEDGTVLSDNKAVQPRFTRRESPVMVFAAPGKTYSMDVNSSCGRAWLNITCGPLPDKPFTLNEITRHLRFSNPPVPALPLPALPLQ